MRYRRVLRLRAEDHHLLATSFEVGQIYERKLVIRFALVHLLLDAAADTGLKNLIVLELYD
ncbi:MAG: hypothetical protein ACK55Z_28060, partial [bacterium]